MSAILSLSHALHIKLLVYTYLSVLQQRESMKDNVED